MVTAELEAISLDLESGIYELHLERNNKRITFDPDSDDPLLNFDVEEAQDTECHAKKCLAQEHYPLFDDMILSPYRIHLQPKQAIEDPNRRYFHVSCLEAIGVDIARNLNTGLPHTPYPMMGYLDTNFFHPAILDWIMYKGKSFDAVLYRDFTKALMEFRRQKEEYRARRLLGTHEDLDRPGEMPQTCDFIQSEPSERKLSDVLLDTMGGNHLITRIDAEMKVMLLEVLGFVPADMSETAVAAQEVAEAANKAELERADSAAASTPIQANSTSAAWAACDGEHPYDLELP